MPVIACLTETTTWESVFSIFKLFPRVIETVYYTWFGSIVSHCNTDLTIDESKGCARDSHFGSWCPPPPRPPKKILDPPLLTKVSLRTLAQCHIVKFFCHHEWLQHLSRWQCKSLMSHSLRCYVQTDPGADPGGPRGPEARPHPTMTLAFKALWDL